MSTTPRGRCFLNQARGREARSTTVESKQKRETKRWSQSSTPQQPRKKKQNQTRTARHPKAMTHPHLQKSRTRTRAHTSPQNQRADRLLLSQVTGSWKSYACPSAALSQHGDQVRDGGHMQNTWICASEQRVVRPPQMKVSAKYESW